MKNWKQKNGVTLKSESLNFPFFSQQNWSFKRVFNEKEKTVKLIKLLWPQSAIDSVVANKLKKPWRHTNYSETKPLLAQSGQDYYRVSLRSIPLCKNYSSLFLSPTGINSRVSCRIYEFALPRATFEQKQFLRNLFTPFKIARIVRINWIYFDSR